MINAELGPTTEAIVLQTHTHKHTYSIGLCVINIQGHLPSTVKASKGVSERADEGGC